MRRRQEVASVNAEGMLTHDQIFLMRLMRNRKDSLFSRLPNDILQFISRSAQQHHAIADIAKLAPYIIGADGRPVLPDVLYNKQPRLLLETCSMGNVGDVLIENPKANSRMAKIGSVSIRHIIRYMYEIIHDADGVPKTKFSKALHHIAFGNPAAALGILSENPYMLGLAGDVITPTGDLICRITPYELTLCIGDHFPDMIPQIEKIFAELEGGEALRKMQYKRYAAELAAIGSAVAGTENGDSKPYDFGWIIDIVKGSSRDDCIAVLNKNSKYESKLKDALIKFRKDFPMRIITRGMLCPYATLQHMYTSLYDAIQKLYYKNENANDHHTMQCNVLVKYIAGFVIRRRLADPERQAFARALLPELVTYPLTTLERSHKFINDSGFFKPCEDFKYDRDEDCRVGSGWDFCGDIYGEARSARLGRWEAPQYLVICWQTYMKQKRNTFIQLKKTATKQPQQQSDTPQQFKKRN